MKGRELLLTRSGWVVTLVNYLSRESRSFLSLSERFGLIIATNKIASSNPIKPIVSIMDVSLATVICCPILARLRLAPRLHRCERAGDGARRAASGFERSSVLDSARIL
jgi:hypothetical protein